MDQELVLAHYLENNVVEKRNYLTSNSSNRGIAWDGKNKNGDFVSSGTYIIRIDGGRFINEEDIKFKRKVCVIGERTQTELFDKDENPIGQYIRIDNI